MALLNNGICFEAVILASHEAAIQYEIMKVSPLDGICQNLAPNSSQSPHIPKHLISLLYILWVPESSEVINSSNLNISTEFPRQVDFEREPTHFLVGGRKPPWQSLEAQIMCVPIQA